MELFFGLLNSNAKFIFQRGKINSETFDVHSFEFTELFEDKPVGHIEQDRMMTTLLKAIRRPQIYFNHSVRLTGGQFFFGKQII